MIKTNFFLVLRKLRKDIKYTTMIVVGLVFGFAGTGLIGLYIANELSVDKFLPNSGQVYQAKHTVGSGEGLQTFGFSPGPLSDALMEVPEVEVVSRARNASFKVKAGEKEFNEFNAMYVDENFFHVFDFPFHQKESEEILEEPHTAVVTESTAQRYFGTTDVIGEFLTIKLGVLNKELKIQGVLKDFPMNSSIQKGLFISMSTFLRGNPQTEPTLRDWKVPFFLTFFKTKNSIEAANLQARLDQIEEKYFGNYSEESYEGFTAAGRRWEFPVERFDQQYINGTSSFRNAKKSDVYILGLVGLVIISLVLFNFINLWTLKTLRRGKEFGVRKFLGASRKQIFQIFLIESLFYLVSSSFLAFAFAEFLLIQFFNSSLSVWMNVMNQFPWLIGLVLVLPLLLALTLSIYPYLSFVKINLLNSLKGVYSKGKNAMRVRNLLLGGQLVITLCFMTVLYFMNEQIQFLMNRDLGWNPENIVVIRDPFYAIYENKKNFDSFISAMENQPGVIAASLSNVNPARGSSSVLISKPGSSETLNIGLLAYSGSFLETFEIDLIEGRMISADKDVANDEVVINKTASVLYEINAGDWIEWYGSRKKVVGIANDMLLPPFSISERPLMFGNMDNPSTSYYVRINANSQKTTIENLGNIWASFMGASPFDHHLIEEDIERSLASESQLSELISYFSVFALLISSLGVLAITGFVCEMKIKEVGIRKVLGAAYRSIYSILSSGFYRVFGIAFIISVPISVWVTGIWLNDFADRISIEPYVFVIIGVLNLLLITGIVLANSIKTMRLNPATVLRDE